MKEKVKDFLDSDVLEKYLLDTADTLESQKAERYIALYPEVRKAYKDLQEGLEAFAQLHSVKTPEGLKAKIQHRIKTERRNKSKFFRYAIAASFVACMFAGVSYFFWNQNQNLIEENTMVTNKIKDLETDMKEQLEDVRNQFIVLNNPRTKKYYVSGNKRAKELKAVAYVNPIKKLSYINVRNLPNLPEDQCYQMWAEVNGELVSLGVMREIKDKDKMFALPYGDNAVGYITIEPNGGNQTPTLDQIVAKMKY
ncbi:anti-sigma factor [Sediminicola luteus]|uniref:RNA polymerase subunit sigma-70 n=1 Tax=Sediminicola luteus TaxID=319238 RepID=A0A2A4G6T5_9FLAO|nr:anti-sigma factor [Sediminicola luteus]PCE63465.1 RNA polymerase subunit sigma-70 [Sediminicola luteus]